jgi:DNA-binding transcriptional regulator GbsR (MarR family)
LISISFCTFLSVTFTISLLTIPNTSVTDKNVQKEIDINTEVLGMVNSEIVKVTDESVQKEIDINTEVLGIVNSEIVKVTDENVQKEIDINTEVLWIVNSEIVYFCIDIYFFLYILICYFYYFTISYP